MNDIPMRHEDKYLLTRMQSAILCENARSLMQCDEHTGEDGHYRISSLYFDDPSDSCYIDSENGNDPREKYRIRMYNGDTSFIRLEKKVKVRGMTGKISAPVSLEECRAIMHGSYPDVLAGAEGIKKDLVTQMQLKCMRPVTVISYDRIPYTYPPCEVRFTIDTDLSYESDPDAFTDGSGRGLIPVGCDGMNIMELKWNGFLPGHIRDILRIDTLRRERFSKYHTCRSIMMG